MEREIRKLVAEIYASKNWHKLQKNEKDLVKALEKSGHIIPNEPANGFVGNAA